MFPERLRLFFRVFLSFHVGALVKGCHGLNIDIEVGGSGACGQPYDWRKPNRLLPLQFGDTTNEQVVFLVYGAPDDNMISALKLVTDLRKGKKLGVEVIA